MRSPGLRSCLSGGNPARGGGRPRLGPVWCLAAAGLLHSCGYVGPPLPPALHIPVPVDDLKAVQRGARIVISFTVPNMTTDDLPLERLGEVELRAGPYERDPEKWLAASERVELKGVGMGPLVVELPVAPWVGRQVMFNVRVASHKRRFSAWPEPVALRVVAPLAPPGRLRAETVPEGVLLRWDAADGRDRARYRVWRRKEGESEAAILAESDQNHWLDRDIEYERSYRYWLQACLDDDGVTAESELSEEVAIVPADVFPPPVPAGLTGVPGQGSVELVWDRVEAADLAGYRLYRAEGDNPPAGIGGLLPTPSYGDRDLRPGAAYCYSVSAVDGKGNESRRSEPVCITVP